MLFQTNCFCGIVKTPQEQNVMKNLKDFALEEKFEKIGSGLPEGETIFDLEKLQVEKTLNEEGKTKYKLIADGKIYFVPAMVMQPLAELSKEGIKKAKVKRTG